MRFLVFSLLVFFACELAQKAEGQDFMKRLEEKLREQLNKTPPSPGSDKGQADPNGNPNANGPDANGLEGNSEETLPAPANVKEGSPIPNPFLLPETPKNGNPLPSGSMDRRSNRDPLPQPIPSRQPPAQLVPPYLGLIAEKMAGGKSGLRVVEVSDGSPAWKAGFRVGDRILAVDGFVVSDLDALGSRLQSKAPGVPVKFLVNRDGRNRDMTAVLLDPNIAERTQPNAGMVDPNFASGQPVLGLSVANLSDYFRRQFGIAAFRGAAVTDVEPNTPASQAGIQAGDCVVEADGEVIQSAADLQKWIAAKRPGQLASLGVYRGRALSQFQLVLGSTVPNAMNDAVDPKLYDPQYASALEAELQRLRQELVETKQRVIELENRVRKYER